MPSPAGPNWFASVMGTGIVATAAATLPVQWPGLREFATVVWVLAAGWLVVLTAAEIVHWARHREAALATPATRSWCSSTVRRRWPC